MVLRLLIRRKSKKYSNTFSMVIFTCLLLLFKFFVILFYITLLEQNYYFYSHHLNVFDFAQCYQIFTLTHSFHQFSYFEIKTLFLFPFSAWQESYVNSILSYDCYIFPYSIRSSSIIELGSNLLCQPIQSAFVVTKLISFLV